MKKNIRNFVLFLAGVLVGWGTVIGLVFYMSLS